MSAIFVTIVLLPLVCTDVNSASGGNGLFCGMGVCSWSWHWATKCWIIRHQMYVCFHFLQL